ncbi:MAG: AAA family ATPase [Oscillospiraceae bacterium]
MRKIAFYGKGGIGKSTITSAVSAALADMGYKVMQIGCDPKADSTSSLRGGRELTPVMSFLRDATREATLEDVVVEGYHGVLCVEAGGPTPGIGCAGRGILTAFNLLEDLHAFEVYKPDFVLFDVLGDVVCGGFAAPIRDGYAEEVVIVTSGEKMALFAARNIYMAIENFKDRGYARVRGVILNRRNVENEEALVRAFAQEAEIPIIGDVPRDPSVQRYENENKTVIEGDPGLKISRVITEIARGLTVEG